MKRTLTYGSTSFSCLDDFSGPVTVAREGRSVELPHVGALRDLLADAMAPTTPPCGKMDLVVLGRGAVLLPVCDLRDFLSVVDPDGPSLPSAPQGYEPTCELRWAHQSDPGASVFADEFGSRWRLEQRWREGVIPGIRALRDCACAWVPVRAPRR